jgi:glycosyltransferase involved in cell wall biosynthesis
MPTRDRRRFVAQSVWYFLRQDYPRRELIVLDDGNDAVEDLLRGDERIRYVRLRDRTALGAKRNLGCELARGELIAHWDDDDWIGPDRLSAQVAQLGAAGADVCGAAELLHYRLSAGDAGLFRPQVAGRPWLAGGTLCYRRAVWAEHPFADLDVAEDADFVRRIGDRAAVSVPDPAYYVAVQHGRNVAARETRAAVWQQRPFAEVAGRLGLDLEFYAALRNGRQEPLVRRPEAARVSLASFFRPWDGYGLMAEYLALGMARSGATVDVYALGLDPQGQAEEFRALHAAAQPDPCAPVLWFAPPEGAHQHFPRTSDLFVNTMWESDELPPSWVAPLCATRAVIVPTRFVRRVCAHSGVTAPIVVVPEGVDPSLYPYVERPRRDGLTTLVVAPLVRRKHIAEAVAAWKLAFGRDPRARLILKGKLGVRGFVPEDPRIEVVVDTEPTRGILDWYRRADVLLALGNEGFGLPLVEAMSTGLPVIALSSEGQGDVCRDASGLVLPVVPSRWEPCDDTQWGTVGTRGLPDVGAVARHLRWVDEHRDEASALGREASAWVARHRNVWDKAPAVLDAMERHVRRPRTLRRLRTLWAPEALRGYAGALARELAPVRLVSDRPALAGLRLLHAQHGAATPEGRELGECVLEASLAGIPTAVTEHDVGRSAHAWERDATALVATTAAGAEALAARWPGKRVEHIPYGCPTWFPARKRRRGRVVALLEPESVDAAADALARAGGGELVLVGGTRASARRGVRVVDAPGSARRLAAVLAREADVVVLPRSAGPETARTVLASGVPVLAPGGSADLEDATHRDDDLAAGLDRLLGDPELGRRLTASARELCHAHAWARVARRHLELWAALEAA